MDPAVLILSYGEVTPMEIVENILMEMKQSKIVEPVTYGSAKLEICKCVMHTKYYSNNICLVPFNGRCEDVPTEIIEMTEALIIYFDSKDIRFVDSIPKIVNFSTKNDIQLGFLITTSFSEQPNELTFQDLKQKTNFLFDIITLKSDNEKDISSEEEKNQYAEIVDGLSNFVWSNVKVQSNLDPLERQLNNTDELEAQLNDFEKLIITAQNLRRDTHLSRDEFLNKAEELAEVISTILNDTDSD
ncbi:uncharacterized protein LOC6642961 [Drosophila willistoni]|uniref:uncharacterized protein LOC6642961 n=1 Tax=Drosophila willistoni TaxID=7260 RepID=UPI000C26D73E|nr:uncharacterized protein LOC6642961 [Drosophila willistoni]